MFRYDSAWAWVDTSFGSMTVGGLATQGTSYVEIAFMNDRDPNQIWAYCNAEAAFFVEHGLRYAYVDGTVPCSDGAEMVVDVTFRGYGPMYRSSANNHDVSVMTQSRSAGLEGTLTYLGTEYVVASDSGGSISSERYLPLGQQSAEVADVGQGRTSYVVEEVFAGGETPTGTIQAEGQSFGTNAWSWVWFPDGTDYVYCYSEELPADAIGVEPGLREAYLRATLPCTKWDSSSGEWVSAGEVTTDFTYRGISQTNHWSRKDGTGVAVSRWRFAALEGTFTYAGSEITVTPRDGYYALNRFIE